MLSPLGHLTAGSRRAIFPYYVEKLDAIRLGTKTVSSPDSILINAHLTTNTNKSGHNAWEQIHSRLWMGLYYKYFVVLYFFPFISFLFGRSKNAPFFMYVAFCTCKSHWQPNSPIGAFVNGEGSRNNG